MNGGMGCEWEALKTVVKVMKLWWRVAATLFVCVTILTWNVCSSLNLFFIRGGERKKRSGWVGRSSSIPFDLCWITWTRLVLTNGERASQNREQGPFKNVGDPFFLLCENLRPYLEGSRVPNHNAFFITFFVLSGSRWKRTSKRIVQTFCLTVVLVCRWLFPSSNGPMQVMWVLCKWSVCQVLCKDQH